MSFSGKSTFARALAQSRGRGHIELDELFWSWLEARSPRQAGELFRSLQAGRE